VDGVPPTVKEEISTFSDEKLTEAWNRVAKSLANQVRSDDAVAELRTQGWSYDAAYWLVNYVRLYGPSSSHQSAAAVRQSARATWWGLVGAGVVGLLLTSTRVIDGALPYLASLGLIGFGIRGLRSTPKIRR
jgi:hypothetical protein